MSPIKSLKIILIVPYLEHVTPLKYLNVNIGSDQLKREKEEIEILKI